MKIMTYKKEIQYYKWNINDTKNLFRSLYELINYFLTPGFPRNFRIFKGKWRFSQQKKGGEW